MQQITSRTGKERESDIPRNRDINEILKFIQLQYDDPEIKDEIMNRSDLLPDKRFLLEVINELMINVFTRLSQIERNVKGASLLERQIESRKNLEQLIDVFGLNETDPKVDDPIHKMRESFMEYFSGIDEPAEFLRNIRENL